jgi:CPA1 family monovalent cation:H+ antiporter
MTGLEHALALLLIVTAASVIARWVPWPRPIVYLLVGLAAGFIPFFPQVELDPAFFFLCFLPPLLFFDGWLMPLREFAKAKGQILLLATGLVAFTTLGVGAVAYWLVPAMPLAMAFALGAVVSPTDAVAVAAITERLALPTRLRIVLNGESLLNDATGLVAFNFALAAMVAGTFSVVRLTGQFVLLAAGGVAIGLAVGWGVGRLRDLLRGRDDADPLIETTLSILTPYAAYLAAVAAGSSGIMAVAAAGLYSGWRDPIRTDAQSRQTIWSVWTTLVFWLNGLAFVLLGLQLPRVIAAVRAEYSVAQLTGLTCAVVAATIVLRIAWVFPAAYLPFLVSRRIRAADERPSWPAVLIGGWAGMRGAVTLAAALSIPLMLPGGEAFPARDIVIFLATGVVVATLLVQGTTMEWLIRWSGLREDDSRAREELLARTAAVESGLRILREAELSAGSSEATAALRHVVAEYEQRLSELGAAGETRDHARERRAAEKRFRCSALVAERETIDRLWRTNVISDEVHRPLQQLLDHEETLLIGRARPVESDATVAAK